ncbi:MAG: sensor histidine kinase, partial [Desulfonatronovibrio sp.]
MRDENKTKAQLISELRELRQQMEEQRDVSRSDRASSALKKNELTSDLLQAKKDLIKSQSETAASDKALGKSQKALRISQQNLSDAHNRYNILSDLVPFGVWTADAQGRITFLSDIFLEMSGIKIEDASKLEWVDQLSRPVVSSAISDWSNSIRKRDLWEGEFMVTGKNCQQYCILVRGVPMLDEQGETLSWLGINLDITERKQNSNQALRDSLKEKEILLREIHHRVKNNLAIISALCEMQSENVEDSATRALLSDLKTRIKSIALVHESLYHKENLAWIDFQDYLDALVQDLRFSLSSDRDIRCTAQAQGISLGIALAIPCGMIVNELVTNALKYAFPDGKTWDGKSNPWISVEMRKDDGYYRIIVADNGVGFPEGLDLNNSASFGLRLVRIVGTHQLGGKFELESDFGARIVLTFRAEDME